MAEQPRVEEMELRAPDQTLAEALEVRRQQFHEVTGAEDGEPALRGDMADARICAQGCQVEQTAHAAGAQPHESGASVWVSHARHLANIALDMGPDVSVVPGRGIQRSIVDRREQAPAQDHLQRELRWLLVSLRKPADLLRPSTGPSFQLGDGEGQELEDGRPPRQRLADPLCEEELLRTGEDEGSASRVVDESLEIGEQVRRSLCLVEHDAANTLESTREATRIVQSFAPGLEVLQYR